MGLLASILSFLGCSEQSKEKEGAPSKKTKEQILQSIEAFKNRPIYKELTEQDIDSTSDDDLLQVIFDNLMEKRPDDHEKEYETVMTWNKSRQAIYMIWMLEAEVNNGGYNQFYFNSSVQFAPQLPEVLKLVGANKFAALTQRANDLFEKEYEKITEHMDGSLEGFGKSYEDIFGEFESVGEQDA